MAGYALGGAAGGTGGRVQASSGGWNDQLEGIYEQRRRALRGDLDATLATNAYARLLSTQRGNRQVMDLDIGRSRGVGSLGSSFARRGLGRSGLLNSARNTYAADWATERNGLMEALREKLFEYDQSDALAQNRYNSGLADLDLQKLRDIMATAGALAGGS